MSSIRVERYGSQYIARCTYEQKDIVKAAGFRWDGAMRQWYTTDAAVAAKLDDVEGLRQRIASANTAKVEAIQASRASDSDADIPRPEGLEYLPYQRAGIAYARRFPTVLIGDDMGLGKTIQAVGIINDDPTIKRVLVVCPASLRLNWRRELKKWLVMPRQIGIVDDGKSYPAMAEIVIINYDLASKHAAALRATEWDLVIVDEAHYCKTPDSKRTVAILGRKQSKKHEAVAPIPARRKVFLTGTPIPNRPVEGWWAAEQLGVMSNFFAFAKRYCAAKETRWGWDFTGSSNLSELQEKLRAGGMIRRLKSDVLKELPPKRRCVIELPTNGAAKVVKAEADAWADHEATIDALRVAVELAKASEDPNDYREAVLRLNKATQVAFTDMSKRRHDTAVAKVPYVVEHLRGIIDQGRKVVCMAHHKDVVDAIMAEFPEAVKVTGDVSMADRQAAVDRFQNDPLCLLFVGNIQAAGVGLTLTAACHVVFAELDWVPGNVTQAEDRCILAGQPILTSNGWVPVEQIEIGDMIMTRSGRFSEVTDKWNRPTRHGKDLIVEVDAVGWTQPLCTTSDHRYLLASGEWKDAIALRPGDRIAGMGSDGNAVGALPVAESVRVPDSFIGVGGKQSNGRKITMPDSVELDEESLFVFGYYLGDGFARIDGECGRFISVAGNDGNKRKDIDRCVRWFEAQGLSCKLSKTESDGHGIEARAYSAEWARWFTDTFGRTCREKRIPLPLLELDRKHSAWLLAGLSASDGYTRRNQSEYCTINDTLASHVSIVVARAGYLPRHTIGSTQQHIISWSHDAPSGYVVRAITIRSARKDQNQRRERVYDLTVKDGESFVLGLAVVHNCHRIGQNDSVLIEHLVLEGSMDARMATALIAKQSVIAAALDELPEQPMPAPVRERGCTEEVSRKQIVKEAAELGPEAIAEIHRKLQMLAGVCDGAKELDGAGFNRFDSAIGKSLAMTHTLTQKQAALGARLVNKYRRQLG